MIGVDCGAASRALASIHVFVAHSNVSTPANAAAAMDQSENGFETEWRDVPDVTE